MSQGTAGRPAAELDVKAELSRFLHKRKLLGVLRKDCKFYEHISHFENKRGFLPLAQLEGEYYDRKKKDLKIMKVSRKFFVRKKGGLDPKYPCPQNKQLTCLLRRVEENRKLYPDFLTFAHIKASDNVKEKRAELFEARKVRSAQQAALDRARTRSMEATFCSLRDTPKQVGLLSKSTECRTQSVSREEIKISEAGEPCAPPKVKSLTRPSSRATRPLDTALAAGIKPCREQMSRTVNGIRPGPQASHRKPQDKLSKSLDTPAPATIASRFDRCIGAAVVLSEDLKSLRAKVNTLSGRGTRKPQQLRREKIQLVEASVLSIREQRKHESEPTHRPGQREDSTSSDFPASSQIKL